MAILEVTKSYFRKGLPYTRIGSGPRTVIIFEGLSFNHKPPSGLMLRMVSNSFKLFAEDFTVYMVGRKPSLPAGYSMRHMSEDYATMVEEELGGPVDINGDFNRRADCPAFCRRPPRSVSPLGVFLKYLANDTEASRGLFSGAVSLS